MKFKEAIIFLNDACNFSCYHCYVKKGSNELSFSDLCFFVDNYIKKYCIERINFVGGEPFLYKKLIPLLEKLKFEKNLEILFTTNGSIWDEEVIDKLKLINLKKIKISLHSINPTIFNKFTGTQNQYQKTLDNIKKFSQNFNVGINTTITKLNYGELDKIISFCEEGNIKSLQISQLTKSGNGSYIKNDALDQSTINNIKKKIKKTKTNLSINYDDHSSCSFGKKIAINPIGELFACPALISYHKYKIGNLQSSSEELNNTLQKLIKIKGKGCFIDKFIN